MTINVMKRYELKYLINEHQKAFFQKALSGHMKVDEYGHTSIASLYYDTPDSRLVRESLEKPVFKEKIRLRSYGLATEESPVFLELKRKYDGVVYKRRVQSVIPEVERFFAGGEIGTGDPQIRKELTFFRNFYKELVPACLIIYDRTAYYEPGGDLRLTIDDNPRSRMEDLVLTDSMDGELLLPEGWSILEIKVQGAMPLWLSAILNEGGIYRNSFSKYGEAYRKELLRAKEDTLEFLAPKMLSVA
jgi:SPX domain protein involved in polyphosphate accumulation